MVAGGLLRGALGLFEAFKPQQKAEMSHFSAFSSNGKKEAEAQGLENCRLEDSQGSKANWSPTDLSFLGPHGI